MYAIINITISGPSYKPRRTIICLLHPLHTITTKNKIKTEKQKQIKIIIINKYINTHFTTINTYTMKQSHHNIKYYIITLHPILTIEQKGFINNYYHIIHHLLHPIRMTERRANTSKTSRVSILPKAYQVHKDQIPKLKQKHKALPVPIIALNQGELITNLSQTHLTNWTPEKQNHSQQTHYTSQHELHIWYISGRQYGGGHRDVSGHTSCAMHNHEQLPGTSLTHNDITPPTWMSISDNTNINKNNDASNLARTDKWRPTHQLPHRITHHPFINEIPANVLTSITQACQYHPGRAILQNRRDASVIIHSSDLQDLISHNISINDQIITMYLEMLCAQYNIKFLATQFMTYLIERGWTSVQKFFDHKTHTNIKPNKPKMNGEPCILIPIHIHNCHWIALSRREINDKVIFMYCDDMNNRNDAADIKHIIQTKTDTKFCPKNAIWIECQSTYYFPHSNECGPRTLMALHMMAANKNPHESMMYPMMHPNIAQISRTWIAASLISGKLIDYPIHHFTANTYRTGPATEASDPFDIIQWDCTPSPPQSADNLSQESSHSEEYPDHFTEHNPSTHRTNNYLMNSENINSFNIPTQFTKEVIPSITHITSNSNNERQPKQQSIFQYTTHLSNIEPRYIHLDPDIPIPPYGTDFPSPDPTKTMRIIMQNTQYAMQLSHDQSATMRTIANLKELEASVFVIISPNINWCNTSHKIKFKKQFKSLYQQMHLSTTCSAIGNDKNYFNRELLPGGAAIATLDHWASKVTHSMEDARGHGTYTVTTLKGRNGKYLSIIGAYISVQKGQNVGPNTVHAQQTTIMEREAMKNNTALKSNFCPRKEAIKELSHLISDLQAKEHAIILLLDANQTSKECHTKQTLKHHSIEWLRIEHGMTDPFVDLMKKRPDTTTLTPGRDIDYILTYGIDVQHITTLGMHKPASSDHQGIGIDINISSLFSGQYSTLTQAPRRLLTMNNIRAKLAYIKYITEEISRYDLWTKAKELYTIALANKFDDTHEAQLNTLDRQLTEIMIKGERQCAKRHLNRDPWSPTLNTAGRTLVYWQRKMQMARKHHIKWNELNNLRDRTNITDEEHRCTEFTSTKQSLRNARKQWRNIRKTSDELRQKFLSDQAEEHALKMNASKEQAMKAILKSEESKRTYHNIQVITGTKKTKKPLTQIDIPGPKNTTSNITLTTKLEIEDALLKRNQIHAQQSLKTPFAAIPSLANAIDPINPNNQIDQILNGTFLDSCDVIDELSQVERTWIQELQQKVMSPIDTYISQDDFKNFFKKRKERTASSPSGRHMGHYKIFAERADKDCEEIIQIITFIINTSIITSRPLHRWLHSTQIMLEKGKGQFIEHLRIIQLCEADLNFALNIIWGKRLIQTATTHQALDTAQYALPGMTCHSAVWNKVLFCDLIRQTLSTGIMTDYDATAAFDRVLHAMSIITCRRLGLPTHACQFMYCLLHNMEFHISTGFGKSMTSFRNNEIPAQAGQGILQGSSSAAPIYNVNSDVSIAAYKKLSTGAEFRHPITGALIEQKTTQYVDDKTDMINDKGSGIRHNNHLTQSDREALFKIANKNSNTWASLLWISGGNLNTEKCFYYFLKPRYNFESNSIKYYNKSKAPGDITIKNPQTNLEQNITRIEPTEAKRTLGVLLAPDGNTKLQFTTSRDKACAFLNQIRCSKLNKNTKWTAINTVMEPAVLYPIMACACTDKEMTTLDKTLSKAKCHALGLNEHFPRAILHGPLHLGGMGVHTAQTKTTTTRITYFLFHTRMQTEVGQKLEASVAYLQLEIGTVTHFLQTSYHLYGHLATNTLIKRIWNETETNGLQLRSADQVAWCPQLQGHGDFSLMEFISTNYPRKIANQLNRYRLYLQVITLYDLLTHDGKQIHPNIQMGQKIPSRRSNIYWVTFPKPPKKYISTWQSFLDTYITPIITNKIIRRYPSVTPHYTTTFFYSERDQHLYTKIDGQYLRYAPKSYKRRNITERYSTDYEYSNPSAEIIASLTPIETAHFKNYIQRLCPLNDTVQEINEAMTDRNITALYKRYLALPKALRQLCGEIQLPPDGGQTLLNYLKDTNKPLKGMSDASLKEGTCSHAWILSTGDNKHILNENMSIHGTGPVDGAPKSMSSARGELHGQTAMAIISKILLETHQETAIPTLLQGDNQGIQQKCNNIRVNRLKHHKAPDMDLLMEFKQATTGRKVTTEWIPGHQDMDKPWQSIQDLEAMKLSNSAIMNTLCDRTANNTRKSHISIAEADVYPTERWALFSVEPIIQKITGKLDDHIIGQNYQQSLKTYLKRKHNLCEAKLEGIDLHGLEKVLKSQRFHQRANTAKLIHRWIPTQAFLHTQHRVTTATCQRCHTGNEDTIHLLKCPNETAVLSRQTTFYATMEELVKLNTSIVILQEFEEHLTQFLDIPSLNRFCPPHNDHDIRQYITSATKHQNIIGWDNFIRGFISNRWKQLQQTTAPPTANQRNRDNWGTAVIKTMLSFHTKIWQQRNQDIHGKTTQEARIIARNSICQRVRDLYNNPPRLAKRYPPINQIPIESRLRKTTQQISDWLTRVAHQQQISLWMATARPPGQLTIQQAFQNAQRSGGGGKTKYPP